MEGIRTSLPPSSMSRCWHGRIDLELAKRVVRDLNKDSVWGGSGGLDPKIAEFTARTGAELGVLKNPIPPAALIDRRFVDVALKEAGPGK